MREVCCLGEHLLKRIRRQCYPQGRSKGLSSARKRLKMVKRWCFPFHVLCQSSAAVYDVTSTPPIFPAVPAQSLLFGASFTALLPHSSFSSPQTAKAAVLSGLLLIFFRRQNSGWPYLPRSPKPGCRVRKSIQLS